MELVQTILTWLFCCFRPAIKWFLRQTTRLCELQRICYGEAPGAHRTCAVELSLQQSRSKRILEAMDVMYSEASKQSFASESITGGDVLVTTADEDNDSERLKRKQKNANDNAHKVINVILHVKKIKRDLHIQFVHSLAACLSQICNYKQLASEVETLRATPYDADNLVHEQQLLQLWSLLQPGVPLMTRKTKQWQNIGFQGDDPKTDFRGMGLLGLKNLLYFTKEYNTAARHILSHSHHPKHGFYTSLEPYTPTVRYSFAIVGINLTHMAYRLLVDGSAKTHMFNVCASSPVESERRPILKHFHHLYSYLFVEFDKFWLSEKPKDVMEFNRIRDLFENQMRTLLEDRSAHFKINIAVDNV